MRLKCFYTRSKMSSSPSLHLKLHRYSRDFISWIPYEIVLCYICVCITTILLCWTLLHLHFDMLLFFYYIPSSHSFLLLFIYSIQGVLISHNASARVIRSNQSLVLQKITRNSSGNYSCSAINAEGETISNPLALRVKCE